MNGVVRGLLAGGLIAIALALSSPAPTTAHPLGNFTINHYAGIRVSPDQIRLDVVIDMAEIPAFQERQRLDLDRSGNVEEREVSAERATACVRLVSSLSLVVDGAPQVLVPTASGLSFPSGAGGLATMRLVCELNAKLPSPISGGAQIAFVDHSYAERIGWREITVVGDRVSLAQSDLPATSLSHRLTAYPTDLLSQPLDVRAATVIAAAGGPALAAWAAPDAFPLSSTDSGVQQAATTAAGRANPSIVGAVPGGVGSEISGLIATNDLSPAVLLASLLVALGLGALHALSPGHGKTVMAAYLVGSRGTARHAIALGLTVTVAHTLGVLLLAIIAVFAADILPPERIYPILGVVSGALVVSIGTWLLVARYHAWATARGAQHDPRHERGHERERPLEHAQAHEHAHAHEHGPQPTITHGHGIFRHSHAPTDQASLSWRSLFALGLSGGLVPSASALILLLGSIGAGRPAYGLVLVVAFGAGMALVLGGVGFALVRASRLLEYLPSGRGLSRLASAVPLATALVVVVGGLLVTGQALSQIL